MNDKSEMAAFLAIPKVLKQGIEIREHDNHKSRGVETVTFSAPVEINGKRGNVAVVVKLTKNYFKALRILTTEGKVYSLSGYEKTEPTPMQRTPKNDTQSASISSDDETIPYSPTESKTKYSMRERDAEYMEAVNTEDTETAQRLVDEAAEDALAESEVRDANGLTAVYHATYNSFTVFERKRLGKNTTGFASDNFVEATAYLGFWFNTQDLSNTVSYAGARGMKCFLNITNPYRTNTQYLAREIESDWNEELSVKENADDYVDYLKRNGYDGIILKDFEFGGTSFVAFDSEQIKSAEAITYDDKGSVIPLSERFNKSDSDIRYSMRDIGMNDTAQQRREREKSYADLKRRNAELERRVEYWKGQTKETQQATVRKTDTDKLARRIAQELGVTDREAISELKDELKRLGDQIVQSTGAELSYSELKESALGMADELLGNISVQLDNTNEDALIRLRDYLSSTKLSMNEREMADLPEGWRREHRRIKLSKDGVPVDTAYMELQEMFGEGTFPSYITAQADMLQQIADVEASWLPIYGNPFESYINETREYVAQEILDSMLSEEIRQTPPTYADRAKGALEKEKAKSAV